MPIGKGGTKSFLRMQRGDQKKLATGHHKQMAPPPGGDSSLKGNDYDLVHTMPLLQCKKRQSLVDILSDQAFRESRANLPVQVSSVSSKDVGLP